MIEETHIRFKIGEIVLTESGNGPIVGVDLPLSKVWRWIVSINGRHMCFFDFEVSKL